MLAHLTTTTEMTPIIWVLTISILGPMVIAAILMILALVFDRLGDWVIDTVLVLLYITAVSAVVVPLVGLTMEALS